ncbi:Carcinine transporter [Armadillidium nasatum]|uniref:Carcinine transporter n=1 Tax=Armadillidium nasatum TaxID=96803 RepID=A0A5N5SZC1_9CRUS|nr:Carcinine transporter [Armadillidium nasatum]
MDFDNLLPEIGEFGTYQKLVMWFLLVPGVIPCGFHAYNQIFMMIVPDHWCKGQNLTEIIPYDNITEKFEKCSKYDLEFTDLFTEFFAEDFVLNEEKLAYVRLLQVDAKVIPCDQGWQYDLDDQTTSIVSDWDLVCEKKFFPTLALVLFGLSGLIGSFIFGFIQDGVLPESPRWLLAKRKKKEAYKIMATMARINKRPLKSDFLHSLKDEVEEKTENLSCVEKRGERWNFRPFSNEESTQRRQLF